MIPAAHLNDTLKRMLPVVGKVPAAKMPRILQSPYLTFVDTNKEGITRNEARAMGVLDDRGFVRTPFPLFRFCMTDHKGRVVAGVAESSDGKLQMVVFHRYEGKIGPVCWAATFMPGPQLDDVEYDGRIFDTRTLEDVTDFVKRTDEMREKPPEESELAPLRVRLLQARGHLNALQKSVQILEGQVGVLDSAADLNGKNEIVMPGPAQTSPQPFIFLALYNSLLVLCYEYLAPHNFRARVTPSAEGKSVEWVRAREHYTVIHRHHSANNAAVKEGQVVTDSKASTRLAHSRRAHTRLLTAAKWKFKRGQRVFVRASWVGPKEWKDTAGQTYQILHELPQ